jgi:hypothetical protein
VKDESKKMSINIIEKNSCLPPCVTGKLHGFLKLTIENIRWTTTKKFSVVDVKLKWWGESEGISVKFNSDTAAKTFYYRINTNFRLLENYLKHCEPIAVQLFSIKNKDLIGCVCIGIPTKLQNIEEDPVKNLKVTSSILSHRNFKIGEMTVSFGIDFNDNSMNQMISLKTRPEKEGTKHVTFKLNEQSKSQPSEKKVSSSNKENIVVVGTKKPILVRNAKPLKQSTLKPKSATQPLAPQKPINHFSHRSSSAPSTSSSSSISTTTTNSSLINYLMGRSMSKSDEARTLNELMESSPSQSVIDELDKISLQAEEINSIKVTINALELGSLGLAEVRSFIGSLHNRKCVIKCAITSKLIKAKADDSNFISYVFDAASQSRFHPKIVFFFAFIFQKCHSNGQF